MENNVKILLEAWKKAGDYNEKEIKKICKKYKVKKEPIEVDEYFSVYQFENGVEFTCPYDQNFEDYELTGDALKFAEKFLDINQESYYMAKQEIQNAGFEEWDDDTYYSIWRKDGKEYSVSSYAKKEDDIEISEVKDE